MVGLEKVGMYDVHHCHYWTHLILPILMNPFVFVCHLVLRSKQESFLPILDGGSMVVVVVVTDCCYYPSNRIVVFVAAVAAVP